MTNAINVILPDKDNRAWVFDDPSRGLPREPFVAGRPLQLSPFAMLYCAPGDQVNPSGGHGLSRRHRCFDIAE